MTNTLRARFDGKVLIPEEQVDLPTDRILELRVENEPQVEVPRKRGVLSDLADWARSLPPLKDAPEDFAAQHDHYIHGTPKRHNP